MSHKFYEFRYPLFKFCRTMKTTTQPYQLNPIPMVSQQKMPAYELSIIIKKAVKGP